jgi:FkbM family methyltransferase
MHSQNNEELIILDYFKDCNANDMSLLDVGANDGITFSNSYALVQNGWNATLLEPSPKAYEKLISLHGKNDRVQCLNYGISTTSGESDFFESGGHNGSSDVSLYSSIDQNEIKRWGNSVAFDKIKAKFKTYQEFLGDVNHKNFDFVTIDIEGYDWYLLNQMDLTALGVKMLIVEWNSVNDTATNMIWYASNFGLKEISRNAENLIFAR